MVSEVVSAEARLRSSGRNAKKRRNDDVEEANDAPSKRTRPSKSNAASASVGALPTKQSRSKASTPATLRPPKKIIEKATRTLAESSSAVTPVQAEINSPPWFSRTLVMLQSESRMGKAWMELVNLWASFEARSRYEEIKKLAPKGRPSAVGEWIGRARPSTWRPVIESVAKYEASFQEHQENAF